MLSRVIRVRASAATAAAASTVRQAVLRTNTTAASHVTVNRSLLVQQRTFSSEPSIKRPRAIKVKKSEARRRVEPKAEVEQNALAEAPQAPPPSPYLQSEQQHEPATFGQVLRANFLFGIGMALAFSLVGAVISAMEETSEPGKFAASELVAVHDDVNDDDGDTAAAPVQNA